MTRVRFFQLFFMTVGVLIAILYTMGLNDKIGDYIDISYYAIPAFSFLSISVYFLTEHLEKQRNKGILLNLVIINVIFKFLIAALVIAVYYKIRNPLDGIFVLPFIIIYVGFTVFETYFMSIQAKAK